MRAQFQGPFVTVPQHTTDAAVTTPRGMLTGKETKERRWVRPEGNPYAMSDEAKALFKGTEIEGFLAKFKEIDIDRSGGIDE